MAIVLEGKVLFVYLWLWGYSCLCMFSIGIAWACFLIIRQHITDKKSLKDVTEKMINQILETGSSIYQLYVKIFTWTKTQPILPPGEKEINMKKMGILFVSALQSKLEYLLNGLDFFLVMHYTWSDLQMVKHLGIRLKAIKNQKLLGIIFRQHDRKEMHKYLARVIESLLVPGSVNFGRLHQWLPINPQQWQTTNRVISWIRHYYLIMTCLMTFTSNKI